MSGPLRLPMLLFLSTLCLSSLAQEKTYYFVDGFHGGTYGHYPIQSYTKYMSDMLDEHPDWTMCIEIEPETWDSVKVATPLDYLRFQDVVKSERVEFTNPTYAQPYMYNITGESIIRQFEYGIRKTREHFPDVEFSTYAVEEPCFTSCLPQILRGFGFKYASLKNPNTCWGGYYAPVEGEIIEWKGPDGSTILCSPRYSFEDLSTEDVYSTEGNSNHADYIRKAFENSYKHPVGMTYQDAGWTAGPWVENIGKSKDPDRSHPMKYITWKEYFESIAKDVKPLPYTSNQEDVRGALVWGSQVMQRIAQNVRSSENQICRAEKMGVIAHIANGYSYDSTAIDEAWRVLLLSEHHDSWIVPYNGLKGNGTWADHICGVWNDSAKQIAARIVNESRQSFGKGRTKTVQVFNTSGSARSEVVCVQVPELQRGETETVFDDSGERVKSVATLVEGVPSLLFEAAVPAFGYAGFRIEQGQEDSGKLMGQRTSSKVKSIENEYFKISLDSSGSVESIIDKKNGGRELIKGGEYSFCELRGFFPDEGRFISSCESEANIMLVEDDDFRKTLRISSFIDVHPYTLDITLTKDDPKIDFRLKIDWKDNVLIGGRKQKDAYNNPERSFYDDRYHLNMYFPTAEETPRLFKGAPFDVCESQLDDTNFHNWNDIKHNILLDWVSLEGTNGGLALFSDHTTSYVYGGGRPLALTLQSSGNGLWGRDYMINGPTELHFCIVPHQGGWEEAQELYNKWNEPLLASLSTGQMIGKASLLDAGAYQLTAAHLYGEDILVRLYNAVCEGDEQQSIKLADCFRRAEEVDLNGNIITTYALNDGKMAVNIPRFGFKTFILKKK